MDQRIFMQIFKYVMLAAAGPMLLASPILAKKPEQSKQAAAVEADHQWVAVGQWNTKPNRIVVLVNLKQIKVDTEGPMGTGKPYIGIPTYIIYESKDKPDFSSYTIRNYCDQTPAMQIADPFTFWRDYRKSNEASAIAFKLPDDASATLHKLVCGDAQAVLNSGALHGISREFEIKPYPNEFPWKVVWLDGERTPYTNVPSRAERDAEFNALMAKAVAMNAEGQAKMEGELRKMDQQAARDKNRPKSKLNILFSPWVGKDEEYIVQNMGMPDKAYGAGSTRMLSYDSRGNWAQVFTTTDENGNVLSTARKDYYCNVTFEFQNDEMIDFKVVGNSCEYGEFNRR
jgi:hypothetical protein